MEVNATIQADTSLGKVSNQPRISHACSTVPFDQKQTAYLDLAITLLLHRWPALTTAVAESWGGPSSADKRDWLAGAVSDLFVERIDTNEEDIEVVLLQVMEDEFEARLEDGSEVEVAAEICRLKRMVGRGEFGEIDALKTQWESRKGKPERGLMKGQVERRQEIGDDEDDETDSSDGGRDDEGGLKVEADEDATMTDAPEVTRGRTRQPPETDQEGFVKVVGKKRR